MNLRRLFCGGSVHDLAGFYEPCRAHDHRLSALPVDFAFLDALMLEVIQQALGQQRHKGQRKAMRFLALEAVLASNVAVRGWKKNYAEYAAIHSMWLPIRQVALHRRLDLARSRPPPLARRQKAVLPRDMSIPDSAI